MEEIRYVTGKQDHCNVSRAATHPLWQTAADALQRLPVTAAPPLPEARVLDLMRKQRRDMSKQQTFGNLINGLVLEGVPKQQIETQFPSLAYRWAAQYVKDQGEGVLSRKIMNADERLSFLRITDHAG